MNEFAPPPVQKSRLKLFEKFSRWYVLKSFHGVRVLDLPELPEGDSESGGLILYCNHPGWWDPLIGILLKQEFFPKHQAYAPIDEAMLGQYGFFKHLGFYGVNKASSSSVRKFMGITRAILQSPGSMIWMTPQGSFVDVRDPDTSLELGISRVYKPGMEVTWLPVALEYCFWSERLPEALVHFGRPVVVGSNENIDKESLHQRLESHLADASKELAQASIARKKEAFAISWSRPPGFFLIYDFWRWLKSLFKGGKHVQSHDNS